MRYKGHEGRHAGWRSLRVLSANAFHVTRMRCKAMEAGTGRPSRRSVPGPGYTHVVRAVRATVLSGKQQKSSNMYACLGVPSQFGLLFVDPPLTVSLLRALELSSRDEDILAHLGGRYDVLTEGYSAKRSLRSTRSNCLPLE